ncbi:hypothetical protein [Intestinimonas massiliensis (ex Afouda et al. 2020)]|uniref:hypothetical protein n=1 Tax=Intestinimonas massiliensis (ex Afouda et al. 2020) TaxID=1673721 RepID=UPI00102F5A30|nr:hypothetical protein [Intestinimonas massiliensis (ex Afouda et al. 2020)]
MKRAIVILALCCALTLSGCSSLLDRPYVMVEPHVEQPAVAGDSSTLQVSTYSELVNAVLFLVSQGTEEGMIQLTDYRGEVEDDLNRACVEVAKDDPLGAYAVDFIKNSYTRVLATYEATISITYRRTKEQVQSLINVTSTSAIRKEVSAALSEYRPELVLRVGYFTGGTDSVAGLVRQAYYDAPASAMGMPECTVTLYPDTGTQRIVEILLTYPEDVEAMRAKSAQLQAEVEALFAPLNPQQYSDIERLSQLFRLLPQAVTYDPGGGSTAWDAIVGNGADSQGLALAFQLLAGEMGVDSTLVEGTLNGEPHFWNQLSSDGGAHYVDLTRDSSGTTWSAQDLLDLGYLWDGAPKI